MAACLGNDVISAVTLYWEGGSALLGERSAGSRLTGCKAGVPQHIFAWFNQCESRYLHLCNANLLQRACQMFAVIMNTDKEKCCCSYRSGA